MMHFLIDACVSFNNACFVQRISPCRCSSQLLSLWTQKHLLKMYFSKSFALRTGLRDVFVVHFKRLSRNIF